MRLPLPQFTSAGLIRRPEPFDHDDYIFELKMDGFRALAHVGPDDMGLSSRAEERLHWIHWRWAFSGNSGRVCESNQP